MSLKNDLEKAKKLLLNQKLERVQYLKNQLRKSTYEDFDVDGFFNMMAKHNRDYTEAKEQGKELKTPDEWFTVLRDILMRDDVPTWAIDELMDSEDPRVIEEALKVHKIKKGGLFDDGQLEKVEDKMSGGLADGMSPEDFNRQQLMIGIKHEMEHTDDRHLAMEIAMDHLAEDPKYYQKLKEVFGKTKSLASMLRKSSELLQKSNRDVWASMPFGEVLDDYIRRDKLSSLRRNLHVASSQDDADGMREAIQQYPEELRERFLPYLGDPSENAEKINDLSAEIEDQHGFGEVSKYDMNDHLTDRLIHAEPNHGPVPTHDDMFRVIDTGDLKLLKYADGSPHTTAEHAKYALQKEDLSDNAKARFVEKLDGEGIDYALQYINNSDSRYTAGQFLSGLTENPNLTSNHINQALQVDDLRGSTKRALLDHKNTPFQMKLEHSTPSHLGTLLQQVSDDAMAGDELAKQKLGMFEPHHLAKILADYTSGDIPKLAANHPAMTPEVAETITSHAAYGNPSEDPDSPVQQEWDAFNEKTGGVFAESPERVAENMFKYHNNFSDDFKREMFENHRNRSDIIQNHHNNPEVLQDFWETLVDEDDPDLTSYEEGLIAKHPNTPKSILDHAVQRGHHKSVLDNPNADHEHLWSAIHSDDKEAARMAVHHPKADRNMFSKFLEKHPPEDELETKIGSHRLRQLRDFVEEKGGAVHKKEAEKAGFNLKALGAHNLPDAKGLLAAAAIQNHIEESPGMKFTHSHDMYGEQEEDEIDTNDWDNWPEDARYHAYEVARDQATESYTEADYIRDYADDILSDFSPEIMDEYKNYYYEQVDSGGSMDEDEREEEFSDDPGQYLYHFYNEVLSRGTNPKHNKAHETILEGYNQYHDDVEIGSPDDYDLREAGFNPIGEDGDSDYPTSEDAYRNAMSSGEQRHSTELSDVFQLNLHPEQEFEMKQAGVWDTFRELWEESSNSGHPVGENGIGWVRYTERPDGVHIDEIQSDFGQSFMKQLKQMKKLAMEGNEQAKDAVERFPEEHVEKINDIVFGQHHPSQILHESFLQYMRNRGDHDKPVHIWHSSSKAPISGQDTPSDTMHDPESGEEVPVKLANWKQLKPEHQQQVADHIRTKVENTSHLYDSAKRRNLVDGETGEINIHPGNWDQWAEFTGGNSSSHFYVHAKKKHPIRDEFSGEYSIGKPLPVHMQQTYEQQPKKMGYQPSKYGKLETQHNPILKEQGANTWEDKVRKTLKFKEVMRKASKKQLRQMLGNKEEHYPAIDWAKRALPREDMQLWFLRAYRKDPSIFNDEMKTRLEHHVSMFENVPAMKNLRFSKEHSLEEGLKILKETEDKGVKEMQENNKFVPVQGQKIVDVGSGWGWYDLGKGSCPMEAKAMGHCGNKPSEVKDDRVLSYRKEHKVGNNTFHEPHLTFIENKGFLGEMKGKANEKPNPRYHMAIEKLLLHPRIKTLVGGGYEEENNFSLDDLSPEQRSRIIEKKPNLDVLFKNRELIGVKPGQPKEKQTATNLLELMTSPPAEPTAPKEETLQDWDIPAKHIEDFDQHNSGVSFFRQHGSMQAIADHLDKFVASGEGMPIEQFRKFANLMKFRDINPEELHALYNSTFTPARRHAVKHPNADESLLKNAAYDNNTEVASDAYSNPNAPQDMLRNATQHPKASEVVNAAIDNPNAEPETLEHFYRHHQQNPNLGIDVGLIVEHDNVPSNVLADIIMDPTSGEISKNVAGRHKNLKGKDLERVVDAGYGIHTTGPHPEMQNPNLTSEHLNRIYETADSKYAYRVAAHPNASRELLDKVAENHMNVGSTPLYLAQNKNTSYKTLTKLTQLDDDVVDNDEKTMAYHRLVDHPETTPEQIAKIIPRSRAVHFMDAYDTDSGRPEHMEKLKNHPSMNEKAIDVYLDKDKTKFPDMGMLHQFVMKHPAFNADHMSKYISDHFEIDTLEDLNAITENHATLPHHLHKMYDKAQEEFKEYENTVMPNVAAEISRSPKADPNLINKILSHPNQNVARVPFAADSQHITDEHISTALQHPDWRVRYAAIHHPKADDRHFQDYVQHPEFDIHSEDYDAVPNKFHEEFDRMKARTPKPQKTGTLGKSLKSLLEKADKVAQIAETTKGFEHPTKNANKMLPGKRANPSKPKKHVRADTQKPLDYKKESGLYKADDIEKPNEPRVGVGVGVGVSAVDRRPENANKKTQQDLDKAFSVDKTWYPESSDKDGMAHPTKPHLVKHTAKTGKPVWSYHQNEAVRQDKKFMSNFNDFLQTLPKHGQYLFTQLAKHIAGDPDRHVIGSGTTPNAPRHHQEMRMRHLNYLMSNAHGYEMHVGDNHIQIKAPRHSSRKGASNQTVWHWDGKNLKSSSDWSIRNKDEAANIGEKPNAQQGTTAIRGQQPQPGTGNRGSGSDDVGSRQQPGSPGRLLKSFRILAKGLRGNWQKEGYSINHDPESGEVTATHPKYGEVGVLLYSPKGKYLEPHNVNVDPAHKRKGISTAMYDAAEQHHGKKFIDAEVQTDEGAAFRQARKKRQS